MLKQRSRHSPRLAANDRRVDREVDREVKAVKRLHLHANARTKSVSYVSELLDNLALLPPPPTQYRHTSSTTVVNLIQSVIDLHPDSESLHPFSITTTTTTHSSANRSLSLLSTTCRVRLTSFRKRQALLQPTRAAATRLSCIRVLNTAHLSRKK